MKLYELVSRDKLEDNIVRVLAEILEEESSKMKVGRGVVISGDALIDIMKSKDLQLKVRILNLGQ